MTSIGGLDVAFGARMQVVRTNVMTLALAGTGLANVTLYLSTSLIHTRKHLREV